MAFLWSVLMIEMFVGAWEYLAHTCNIPWVQGGPDSHSLLHSSLVTNCTYQSLSSTWELRPQRCRCLQEMGFQNIECSGIHHCHHRSYWCTFWTGRGRSPHIHKGNQIACCIHTQLSRSMSWRMRNTHQYHKSSRSGCGTRTLRLLLTGRWDGGSQGGLAVQ